MGVWALHKPRGITCEQASPATGGSGGRKRTLNDWLQGLPAAPGARVSAVGRLDKDTSGLLLLTDDGALSELVLRPGMLSKVYEATTRLQAPNRPSSEQLAQLVAGVELADGPARAASAEVVSSWSTEPPQHLRSGPKGAKKKRQRLAADKPPPAPPPPPPALNSFVVSLTISIGRNRVVRRLCAAVGLPVFALKRVQFGPLHIERDLRLQEEGQLVRLTEEQVLQLRAACGARAHDAAAPALPSEAELAPAGAEAADDARSSSCVAHGGTAAQENVPLHCNV
jgi:pseudouridine synthase